MSADMPPIRNYPLYVWRVFVKLFSFFLFGLGTLVLLITLLPFMRLVIHPRQRFQQCGHVLISRLFFIFALIMSALGGLTITIDRADRERLKALRSKIIIANHPSLLDVVFLIAFIRNADCIVNARLLSGITGGIIRNLYIPNSLSYDELIASCARSLDAGNCLIIFPEGTRTPRTGTVPLKKGAARIAVHCQCGIIPVHIGGNDKYGLGKHDPLLGYNHTEKYRYELTVLPELAPVREPDLPPSAAANRLHNEVKRVLPVCQRARDIKNNRFCLLP